MMNAFSLAVQFLTRVPIRSAEAKPRDVAGSYYFYPFIGLCIGIIAVVVRRGMALVFPPSFSIVVVLAFLSWITGGLHDDGLADVADGMAGGWNREQRLEIMKDSRIGAFGALALVLVVLAKYVSLTAMTPSRVDGAILTAQILGRWTFLPLGYFNPPAREGLGSEFMKGLQANTVVAGLLFSGALVILLFKAQGAAALVLACMVVASASIYFRSKIGGITGDCFGATYQLVEIATYAVFLA
jgi:adenosylcobinamide-GDP ribazoletransferase